MIRIKSLVFFFFYIWPLAISADQASEYTDYFISPKNSWIKVLIYPDGPLKHLGHHHVISHQNIEGNVRLTSDPINSVIDIELAVDEFTVDDYELRKQEGGVFEGEVPQKDIDGTKENMLGQKLLSSTEYPYIKIRSKFIEGQFPDFRIHSLVNIKEQDFNVTFPAKVKYDKNSFLSSGEFSLGHNMLGLIPFSAAGGLLTVRDLMIVKYEIRGISKPD
jgi:hypothetical protein